MQWVCRTALIVALLAGFVCTSQVEAGQRIKDVAAIGGVRQNQLVGYGLLVGLDGSGDQTAQTPFTTQATISMLGNLGIALPAGSSLQLKNVAAVMLTATLPAFARPGQTIDVTVSSLGNAKSLRGGTLISSPLKGADGNVYAIAQGNVVVGGAGASAGGSKTQINHLSVGRIPGGATVERTVPAALGDGETISLELHATDFGAARRIVEKINLVSGEPIAQAVDGRLIKVRAPVERDARVAFIGRLENMEIETDLAAAKVVVNSRTGSVVMNETVMLSDCAVSHGNLTVSIKGETAVSQPNPLSAGQTAVVESAQIEIKQGGNSNLIPVKGAASLQDVVRSLNMLGATPMDLINILQAMKAVGALRAEVEVI